MEKERLMDFSGVGEELSSWKAFEKSEQDRFHCRDEGNISEDYIYSSVDYIYSSEYYMQPWWKDGSNSASQYTIGKNWRFNRISN